MPFESGVGMMVSILVAGAIAETIGLPKTVMLGASVCVLGIIPLMTSSLLKMHTEPAGHAPAEAPA